MDTYTLLRAFADSWFLIAMFGFFLGVWVFAFWPSLKAARDDAASIPLRDDTVLKQPRKTCTKQCATCACKTDFLKGVQDG